MSALERYLRRVAFWLPSDHRRATVERIRSDLEEHLEDAAESLGRDLSDEEVGLFFRTFGPPALVATRYSDEPPLISGGLMVVYRRVLILACLAVVSLQLILLLPELTLAPSGTHGLEITSAGGRTVYGLLLAFTSITIVFALLSRLYVPKPRAKQEAGL